MSKRKAKPNQKMQDWIAARKRHHLSHAHVQMARELGMNPKKLGKIDNHKQEPWKLPLPRFIEELYEDRFGKERPDLVLSTEDKVKHDAEKKERKREVKRHRLMEQTPSGEQAETPPTYYQPPDDFEMFIEDDIPF